MLVYGVTLLYQITVNFCNNILCTLSVPEFSVLHSVLCTEFLTVSMRPRAASRSRRAAPPHPSSEAAAAAASSICETTRQCHTEHICTAEACKQAVQCHSPSRPLQGHGSIPSRQDLANLFPSTLRLAGPRVKLKE